jgi:hydroxymethylbilane synthase
VSLRIGTRGSALALAQARWVAGRLEGAELVTLTTTGDAGARVEDKARWVDAIEAALVAREIDLAVHSAKDVPGTLAPGCAIIAVPERADARDVLVGAASLEALPAGARVGTSSLRRRAQLLAARPDLEVVELRGNVDTRLRKLAAGEADALVLAAAGLARLGLPAGAPLDFVPAPGQGALILEARAGDDRALRCETSHARSFAAVRAERAAVAALGATCHTPVGAWAVLAPDGAMRLRGFAGLPDGSEWVADDVTLAAASPEEAGEALAERLLVAGAGELLERATAAAAG